jgi:hypothetical protein
VETGGTYLQKRHILPNTAPRPNPKRDPVLHQILRRQPLPLGRRRPLDPPLGQILPGIGTERPPVQVHRYGGHAHRRAGGEVRAGQNAAAGGDVAREVDGRRRREAQGFLDAGLEVGEAAEFSVGGRLRGRGGEGGAQLGDEARVDGGVGEDVVEGVAQGGGG